MKSQVSIVYTLNVSLVIIKIKALFGRDKVPRDFLLSWTHPRGEDEVEGLELPLAPPAVLPCVLR